MNHANLINVKNLDIKSSQDTDEGGINYSICLALKQICIEVGLFELDFDDEKESMYIRNEERHPRQITIAQAKNKKLNGTKYSVNNEYPRVANEKSRKGLGKNSY